MDNTIIIENKIGMLHVPKTGGTFIQKNISKYFNISEVGECHDGYKQVAPFTNHVDLFCFVRDPFSWMVSWWSFWKTKPSALENTRDKYIKGQPRGQFDNIFSPKMVAFTDTNSFEMTVKKYLEISPGFISNMYSFYTDGCKHVGKQENLVNDLERILGIYGIKDPVKFNKLRQSQKQNVSNHYQTTLSSKLMSQFKEAEVKAYRKYGY